MRSINNSNSGTPKMKPDTVVIKNFDKVNDIWKKMMSILTPEQKKRGLWVLFLTLIGAGFETLGVSSVIPLVEAMVSPEELLKYDFVMYFKIEKQYLLPCACILVVAVFVVKNLFLSFLLYTRSNYSCTVLGNVSVRLLKSYMGKDYIKIMRANTGELIQNTRNDAEGIYIILLYGLRLIAEFFTVALIFTYLLYLDMRIAVSIMFMGIVCFIIIFGLFRKSMKRLGERIRKTRENSYNASVEIFGGMKEIILSGNQNFFVKKFESAYREEQKIAAKGLIADDIPVYILEGVCVIGVIGAVGLKVSGMDDPAAYIPYLGSFAMAGFRLMPSMGRISGFFNTILFRLPILNEVYEKLNEAGEDLHFRKSNRGKFEGNGKLVLKGVSFRYSADAEYVLKDVSINIKSGESVGIIGGSGAGKSTLMDIILGVLHIDAGEITYGGQSIYEDFQAYYSCVGYVPQSVYLLNDTIKANVAFGLEPDEIDEPRVWECLEIANIAEFVRGLPKGLETMASERGARFSGGQKQRIAIARALYNDPKIIVFDEATSALDYETEESVMKAIEDLFGKKTIIIVAHRLTTVRNCDEIYEIKDGKAVLHSTHIVRK